MASILKRLHRATEFESADEVQEFEQKLEALIARGAVEKIPVGKPLDEVNPEIWIRDRKSGEVWRYQAPEFPLKGHFGKVEDPEARSYFRGLEPAIQLPPEPYRALVAKLEAARNKGEIERAFETGPSVPGTSYFYHEASDEAFQLVPPRPGEGPGLWMKVFRSKKNGTWPGETARLG